MPADSRNLVQTASICRYSICCLTGQRFVLSFSLIHNVQRISAYPAEQKENFHPSRLCLGQSLPESRVSVHIGPHLGDPFHLDHKSHPAADPGLLGLGQFLKVLDAPLGRGVGEVADAVYFQRCSPSPPAGRAGPPFPWQNQSETFHRKTRGESHRSLGFPATPLPPC